MRPGDHILPGVPIRMWWAVLAVWCFFVVSFFVMLAPFVVAFFWGNR